MQSLTRSQVSSALLVANVLLFGLSVLFAVGAAYAAFFYEPELDPKLTARYAAVAKQRLAARSDDILEEVSAVASETAPPLGRALYEQARDDYKLYLDALAREGDIYVANTQKMLVVEAKAQYREYLQRHRQVLREEFPEHASDENIEQVLNEFEQTFNRLIERYYLGEFKRETDRTLALWKNVEPLELPTPNEPSLEEQMADFAADWAILAAAEPAPASTAAKPMGDTSEPAESAADTGDKSS